MRARTSARGRTWTAADYAARNAHLARLGLRLRPRAQPRDTGCGGRRRRLLEREGLVDLDAPAVGQDRAASSLLGGRLEGLRREDRVARQPRRGAARDGAVAGDGAG